MCRGEPPQLIRRCWVEYRFRLVQLAKRERAEVEMRARDAVEREKRVRAHMSRVARYYDEHPNDPDAAEFFSRPARFRSRRRG